MRKYPFIWRRFFAYSLIALTVACSPIAKNRVSTASSCFEATPSVIYSPKSTTPNFSESDRFGDGYIAQIPIEDASNLLSRDVVERLMIQWLGHYRTRSKICGTIINDYKLESITLKNNSIDPEYEVVAWVNFTVAPLQLPNEYWKSFITTDKQNLNAEWYELGRDFGVFRDNGYFKLRILMGWGI